MMLRSLVSSALALVVVASNDMTSDTEFMDGVARLQHILRQRASPALHVSDPTPKPHDMDGKCVLEHCAGATGTCMLDSDCRNALLCTRKCGNPPTNQTCIFQCQSDFENDVYNDMIKCWMQDNDCEHYQKDYKRWTQCKSMDKVPPLTTFRGQPLTADVANQLLEKNWVVARGKSKAYDCFDCQFLYWIARPDGDMNYAATYKIHKSNGDIRWNQCLYTAKNWQGSVGRFRLNVTNYGGLSHLEDWRLLGADESATPQWIAMYYCGDAAAVGEAYEGAFVLTPDGVYPKDPAVTGAIDAIYEKAGLNLECYPDNTKCAGHPGPPAVPTATLVV